MVCPRFLAAGRRHFLNCAPPRIDDFVRMGGPSIPLLFDPCLCAGHPDLSPLLRPNTVYSFHHQFRTLLRTFTTEQIAETDPTRPIKPPKL